MSNMLSREAIFAVEDLQRERVEVPEWGGHVYVCMMSAREQEQFQLAVIDGNGQLPKNEVRDVVARLVVFTTVDEQGKRLFTEDDIPALTEKSVAAMARIIEVARRLNAVTDEEIEELAKN